MDSRPLNNAEKAIYDEARRLLDEGMEAPMFSERFFGPEGRLRGLAATAQERAALTRSTLYQWLQEQVERLRGGEARRFEQETAAASGRLTIVVPRSLHAALKSEAVSEGVSLSELIRLKLGVPYRTSTLLMVGSPTTEGARGTRRRSSSPQR